jgi:hypothetical protein
VNALSQVYQRQLSKQGLQSIVVDEKEQANALSRCVNAAASRQVTAIQNCAERLFDFDFSTSEDLHDVFTLREDTDCDTYDMIRCSYRCCC